jgi:N-acetylglucosaminyl-diphospho-decaprenol L-rhamnosyltransferase
MVEAGETDGLVVTDAADVSAIVVSHNTRVHLERCLASLGNGPNETIVVDNASTDGSVEAVRERFPSVRLITLRDNRGFGAAANEGMRHAYGRYFLLLNADTWPRGDAVRQLVAFADEQPRCGAVGPRLLRPDATVQRSVRGFPTLWRLATEYFFLRWFGLRTNALNAFYGANFDHRSVREAEFLEGAVLLLRRQAVEEVGGFDDDFFMFNEEVDLCYRLRRAGWSILFFPGAEFSHVGGAATQAVWPHMYREQLRSHLRFLAKHRGLPTAERGRMVLLWAQRVRALAFRLLRNHPRAQLSREAAHWLRSAGVRRLLDRRTQ